MSHQHQHQYQHQHQQHRHHHHRNKAPSESLHAAAAANTEHATVQNYQPPAVSQSTFFGHASSMTPPNPPPKPIDYVYNPSDGSVLLDHNGRPISVDKLLATKPLRGELSTRPGPGNKKLTYISGDGISRTLNDIFGFDGWNLDITSVQREETMQNQGKYTVVYTAQVRLTHKASGAYKEDCGAGDATDKSFATAVGHALKQSITDAMKRAARHFGDKLGNSLYSGNFSVKTAPTTLKNALDKYDIERANTKFGFAKDQVYNQNMQPTNDSGAVTKNQETTPVTRHGTTARNNITDPLANRSSTINESANTAIPARSQQPVKSKNLGAAPNVSSQTIQTIPLPTNSSRQVTTAISTASGHPSSQQQRASSGPSNTMQHGPPILPSPTSNNNYNNTNSQIGPPPTPTDALRNSVLFSQQPRPPAPTAHLAATGMLMPGDGTSNSRHCNPPTRTVSTDIPNISFATNSSSSRGRLSLGQTPIRLAPLVTPSNTNTNNPMSGGKRPNDSAGGSYSNLDGHKRQRNVNNPYMAT